LDDKTVKRVILSILMSACTVGHAQTQANFETLNRLWLVLQQIDAQNMERVSEEKLGVKIELPVESTRPPSAVLMALLSGSTTWLFSKRDLEALQTNISAIRYERHHYYSNNKMQYQLGVGLDKTKSCIAANDVREFLTTTNILKMRCATVACQGRQAHCTTTMRKIKGAVTAFTAWVLCTHVLITSL
jgi:hypothetical protein